MHHLHLNIEIIYYKLPCTVPQGYCLERIILLPTRTKSVLPTTAKGTCVFIEVFTSATLSSSVGN